MSNSDETHEEASPAEKKIWYAQGIGMPYSLLLNEFGNMIYRTFGTYPFLVGSVFSRRDPRDIDVRLVLSDEQFHALFRLSSLNLPSSGWACMCMVWSAYGTALGLKPT